MEILIELEHDDALRRRHRGQYLCFQRSIGLDKSREARQQRIGQDVMRSLGAFFIVLPQGAEGLAKNLGHLTQACIPEDATKATERQARRLLEGNGYGPVERSICDSARKAAVKADVPTHSAKAAASAPDQKQSTPA
ncbi:hypothetical protein [Pseudorhodoferax soli]|uniref:hypothetical protein n=1 Tax=Pseudorhodoferax soli TaxID=545864 RepID=UPI0011C05EBA|nr:hypothetical protein [Pseudorhodoferax soli]